MLPSRAMKDARISEWLNTMQETQPIINALTSFIAPHTYEAGCKSIKEIKKIQRFRCAGTAFLNNILSWSSVFSGISVISNRKTKYHADKGGHRSVFDLLVSCGTHSDSKINVQEFKMSFQYHPGTVFAINGTFLHHGVDSWTGGDRICYAHYMKQKVHQRTGVGDIKWQNIKDFEEFIIP